MAQTNTTFHQLEKPTPGTAPPLDVALINRNMDKLDKTGIVVCTSTTRPSSGLFEGMRIYETDTNLFLIYSGSAWIPYAWEPVHEEWTTSWTLSPNGGAVMIGGLNRDTGGQIGTTGRIVSPASGELTIKSSGRAETWSSSIHIVWDGTLGGRSFIEMQFYGGAGWEPIGKNNIAAGDVRGTLTVTGVRVPPTGDLRLRWYMYQQSGADRLANTRNRLDRMTVGLP